MAARFFIRTRTGLSGVLEFQVVATGIGATPDIPVILGRHPTWEAACGHFDAYSPRA